MPDVGRHRHDLRVASTHELGVHHGVVDPHVREQAAVAIARLHVHLEPHVARGDEGAIDVRRLASSRLFALPRVMHFRGVDADVPDLLDAIADADVDRVAVDDTHDRAFERASRSDGSGEEDDETGSEHASARAQHALTVSC